MDILIWILVGIFVSLVWGTWSMSYSFFAKGRIRGIRECVREIRKGMAVQIGHQDEELPDDLKKAWSDLARLLDRPPLKSTSATDPIHAQLWTVGRTLADVCWLKGHAAGIRRKAPAEGKIRIDLTVVELLQLGGLANHGFQHMIPSARLFDLQRFTGRDDANEAAQAVGRLEAAIPTEHRPDLIRRTEDRMKLIDDWWTPVPKRAIA